MSTDKIFLIFLLTKIVWIPLFCRTMNFFYYCNNLKYLDTLSTYHTFLKLEIHVVHSTPIDMSKILWYVWQTV